MEQDALQAWLEGIWALREEDLYQRFFATGPGIYTIPNSTFESIGCKDVDPRFLCHGVFECPPAEAREHWIYVSSGMSNPWGENPESVNPAGYSGLGYEFVMHARERGRWPIQMLHWLMAVQLLVAAGQLQGELLQRNDRVPLGGSLGKKEGQLTHLLIMSPDDRGLSPAPAKIEPGYPAEFSLPSGRVEMLLVLGISGEEADFARTQGADGLITLLRHQDVFPMTDPGRASVV